ncbi:MAG: hypothetical protein WKF37_16870 [Bryobacteraceae bacterium]
MLTGYSGGKPMLLPEKQFRGFEPPPKTLPAASVTTVSGSGGEGGKPASCRRNRRQNDEIALVGTLAARTARYLEWDSSKLAVTNVRTNWLVNPPYRPGWSL